MKQPYGQGVRVCSLDVFFGSVLIKESKGCSVTVSMKSSSVKTRELMICRFQRADDMCRVPKYIASRSQPPDSRFSKERRFFVDEKVFPVYVNMMFIPAHPLAYLDTYIDPGEWPWGQCNCIFCVCAFWIVSGGSA